MAKKIIQGSDVQIAVQLVKQLSNGSFEVIDISTPTALKACFKNEDGTTLEKTIGSGVTVTNGPSGKATIDLDETETAALNAGIAQSFEMELEKPAGNTQIIQFVEAIDVIERVC